jgi:HKD family nuclease
MLHPKYDRIDYGEQLIPPDGYDLAQAIGTTYSLDLETLMVLPVALFYAQTLDGDLDDLRYDMLDAITKAAEKITIYCQKGQMKVPQKYHHLMAYWEKGIEAITMTDHVRSFHPKVWIIRYESEGQPPLYRVLVTSRNLTFARDWDVAFSTDGTVGDKEHSKNKPLVHFLHYLNDTGKREISASFMQDLMKVKFAMPDKFEGLKFIPIGIQDLEKGKPYTNPLTAPKTAWDQLLIVSPFADQPTLDALHKATKEPPYLLSRKEEMDGVTEETLKHFDCWQFSQFIQQAEYMQELSEGDVLPSEQNLHAKLFVAMTGKVPYWYLGSANCTDPARGRNVEFMVELEAINASGFRTKDVLSALTDTGKTEGITLFEPYDFNSRVSTEETKRIDLDIRKIKYDLSLLFIKGTVARIEDGTAYNLMIEIDASKLVLPAGYQVKMRPLPEQQKAAVVLKAGAVNTIIDFTGYSETALSPFLEFSIYKDSIVHSRFLLPMEIELPQSRLNRIFTSIINSREKFLKYLTFLLTGEETDVIGTADRDNEKKSAGTTENVWAFSGTPVFEKLLVAASRYPHRLKSIDALMQRLKAESASLDEPIITEEFESFWWVFKTFMESKR